MKTKSQWGQRMALLSSAVLAAGSLNLPAQAGVENSAVNNNDGSVEIAQASLCRRVNVKQGLTVRAAANSNSAVVGGVELNRQVTLVEGFRNISGPDGRVWVEISAPVRGFVSAGYPNSLNNLVNCNNTSAAQPATQPTAQPTAQPAATTANLCRQVDRRAAPQGLLVRADATPASALRGSVPTGGKVTLVSGYQLVRDKSGATRNWVQITAPVAGFVSANSLIMCR